MTKARFDFIALKTYIDGLLTGSKELDEDGKYYKLYFSDSDLERLSKLLSELEQSIDSGEEV